MRIVASGDVSDQWIVFAPGRVFGGAEVGQMVGLVRDSPQRSRSWLAREICELLDWRRANGSPKLRECWEVLWRLEQAGAISLPELRNKGRRGQRARTQRTLLGEPRGQIACALAELRPLTLEVVEGRGHTLFGELIDRYHYLGFAVTYGAQLRYFVRSCQGELVACLQFSSAAWRLAARDRWIGWSTPARLANLPEVVQQSRFLILPWVRVPHLASHILACSERALASHWERRYTRRPVLLETLVDPRFAATCYRAANWIGLGDTTGRGRMDRHTQRVGAAIKRIYIKPLMTRAREQLCRA